MQSNKISKNENDLEVAWSERLDTLESIWRIKMEEARLEYLTPREATRKQPESELPQSMATDKASRPEMETRHTND